MDHQEKIVSKLLEEYKDGNRDLSPATLKNTELILNLAYGAGAKEQAASQSHRKAVLQLDKWNNVIDEFPSAAQAQRETKINKSCIANVCNGRYGAKTAGGYKWRWK